MITLVSCEDEPFDVCIGDTVTPIYDPYRRGVIDQILSEEYIIVSWPRLPGAWKPPRIEVCNTDNLMFI